jgi:hypothetical protein
MALAVLPGRISAQRPRGSLGASEDVGNCFPKAFDAEGFCNETGSPDLRVGGEGLVARDEYYRNFPPVRYALHSRNAISLPKADVRDDKVGRSRIRLAYRVDFGIDDGADMMAHILDDDLKLQRHQRFVLHDHDLSPVPGFYRRKAGI